MKKISTVTLLAAMLFSGCSTIVGGHSDITIDSNPSGASCTLYRDSKRVRGDETPYEVSVSNYWHNNYTVDCNGSKGDVGRTFNPWFLGNIIIGGFVGVGVDILSGAVTKQKDITVVISSK